MSEQNERVEQIREKTEKYAGIAFMLPADQQVSLSAGDMLAICERAQELEQQLQATQAEVAGMRERIPPTPANLSLVLQWLQEGQLPEAMNALRGMLLGNNPQQQPSPGTQEGGENAGE